MEVEKKKTKGRQKIEMRKMEDERSLMVTFSKRRHGLFKKASEICTLCGAELAIIVFSPNHLKVYPFGHPDTDTVIDRFLTQNPQSTDSAAAGSSSFTPADNINLSRIISLNRELTGHLELLEEEKEKGKRLDLRRSSKPKSWWENPIEEMDLEHLEKLKKGLKQLKKDAMKKATSKHLMEAANSDPFFGFNSLAAALPMYNDNRNNLLEYDPNDQIFGHGP